MRASIMRMRGIRKLRNNAKRFEISSSRKAHQGNILMVKVRLLSDGLLSYSVHTKALKNDWLLVGSAIE